MTSFGVYTSNDAENQVFEYLDKIFGQEGPKIEFLEMSEKTINAMIMIERLLGINVHTEDGKPNYIRLSLIYAALKEKLAVNGYDDAILDVITPIRK